MANPQRGEHSVTVGETTYTLRFTLNALCEVEEAAGVSVEALLGRVSNGNLRDVRLLVWGALRDAHPELTLTEAGTVLGAVMAADGMEAAEALIVTAIEEAFPTKTTNPRTPARRKKKRKAGTRSSAK